MTRNHGSQIKWLAYSLAYVLMHLLKFGFLNRMPMNGAVPELATIAVAAVGCFEGPVSGSLYGLGVGLFCSAVYYRVGSMMIAICTLVGWLSGLTTDRQVGKNFLGVSLCGSLSILLLESVRVFYYYFFGRNSLEVLLDIAVPEGIYSLIFVIPMYFMFAVIFLRFRTDMEL